jgi:DMSO/TMAO reductase YedYZ molybdopterin-dependent catalytic subunit
MDRRRFISIAGGAGLGLLLPYALYRSLAYGYGASHVNVRAYEKFGPEAALRAIAPVDQFYITSSHGEPAVDVNKWSLTIDGVVTDPLHFDYDDIRKLAPYETTLTLECISNEIAGGLIDTANWRGTLLRPLLERAGLKLNAKFAILYAAEGYTTGHTVERLMQPGNFLAYDMDGEPLNRIHGFPLRVLMPGIYGMKTPKWLTRIELVDKHHLGYWEWMGWSDTGERQLQSVIDDPHDSGSSDGAIIAGKSFVITGWAITNEVGVAKVEISTDGGATWNPCQIFSNPNPSQVWAFWRYVWANPTPGKHEIQVRATDANGKLQTSARSGEWPDGATGYHTITVNVT